MNRQPCQSRGLVQRTRKLTPGQFRIACSKASEPSNLPIQVNGYGTAVGGAWVAVGATGVAVGGAWVAVGGAWVAVGGTWVAVGGAWVAVGAAVGGTAVGAGGTAVGGTAVGAGGAAVAGATVGAATVAVCPCGLVAVRVIATAVPTLSSVVKVLVGVTPPETAVRVIATAVPTGSVVGGIGVSFEIRAGASEAWPCWLQNNAPKRPRIVTMISGLNHRFLFIPESHPNSLPNEGILRKFRIIFHMILSPLLDYPRLDAGIITFNYEMSTL